MVVVPVIGGAALDAGDALASGIDVFAGWGRGYDTVDVLGEHLRAKKNGNGGGAAGDFLHALAVAVIGVDAGSAAVARASGAVFAIVDDGIDAVVGHVSGSVISIAGSVDTVIGSVNGNRIGGAGQYDSERGARSRGLI